MASAGRWDRQFLIGLYTLIALAGLVLAAWVTLGRFGVPVSVYILVTVVGLGYGFLVVWFGASRRSVAIGGFVGIFAAFWFLSASQKDFGVLQYAWILAALAGGTFARKEFPWAASRRVRDQRERQDGLLLLAGQQGRASNAISEEDAVALARRLDGGDHSVVSFERYGARLDICGSAASGEVLFFNYQPDDLNSWSQVREPNATEDMIDVRVGRIDVQFEVGEVLDVDSVVAILRTFAQTGDPDSRFTWVTSPSVINRRVVSS